MLIRLLTSGKRSALSLPSPPEEVSVKSITATENSSDRKFMKNGRLIIQKNGQRYNVAGQMVKEK